MSEPPQQGKFLQETRKGTATESGLFTASIAIGAAAGLWWRSLAVGALAAAVAYFILSILYAIVALIFLWRRLRWMAFIGTLLDLMSSA